MLCSSGYKVLGSHRITEFPHASGYDYAIVSTYAVVTVNIHSSHVDYVLSTTIYLPNHFESISFRGYD